MNNMYVKAEVLQHMKPFTFLDVPISRRCYSDDELRGIYKTKVKNLTINTPYRR